MRRRIGRDAGLSARMFITMALLAAVYLAFFAFLVQQGTSTLMLVAFAAVMLGVQWYFSDRMALMSMRAKIVSESDEPELHEMVSRLAAMASIPKPRVAISDLPIPNAFATGRSQKKAVVAVTRQLMQTLPQPELEAVLAHEITHVVHRDVTVMTLASFFATVAAFIMRSFFWFGGGRSRDREGGGSMVAIWVASMAVWFISQLLILALARYREFAADRGAVQLTGSPSDMASALVRISGAVERIPKHDLRVAESMNAFFIVSIKFREIFSTHPSLEKRLAQLDRMQRELEGRS